MALLISALCLHVDSVFWLEDHNGVVYFWSRIDDSMIRGGDNLKEALTNYLFYQEKLYYVDEITCELVPINAYDKEAEEWAKSPEAYIYFDATKVSPKHELEKRNNKKSKKRKRIKRSIDMKIIPVCSILTLIILNPIYSCIISYHLYSMISFIGNLYKSNVQ